MADLIDAFESVDKINGSLIEADSTNTNATSAIITPMPGNVPETLKDIYDSISEINKKQNRLYIYFKNLFDGNDSKYDETFKKKVVLLFNDFLRDSTSISSTLNTRKYLYTLNYKDGKETKPFFDDENQFLDEETQKSKFSFCKLSTVQTTFLNKFLSKIKSNEFVIIEYSSKADNLKTLDQTDMEKYIIEFRNHLVYNNYGKDTLNIQGFDNSLFVKKNSILDFFLNFNKLNGFQYMSIKQMYETNKEIYAQCVATYNEALDDCLSEIDTYINNNELQALAGMGIWHIMQNYWGIFIICLLVFVLVFMYVGILLNFFNSLYFRFISLETLNKYKSQYFGYDTIQALLGYYLDYSSLIFLTIYIIFFILFIPINLIYFSDFMRTGSLRILGCSTIFNKQVDIGIYTIILFYIFFILLNIAYYMYILSLSDSYKMIGDNHAIIDSKIRENINEDLMTFLQEEHSDIFQIYDKVNYWAYNGTKEQNDARAGNTDNKTDMLEKRFKMLITAVMANDYINNRNKDAIISDKKNSIFLYAREDKPILPAYVDINKTNIFKAVAAPLSQLRRKKCEADDNTYFCQNKGNWENNIYKMQSTEILALRDKYIKLKKEIDESTEQIKKYDNIISHKISIIISSIFLVFYMLLIIQVLVWLFAKRSIIPIIKKNLALCFKIFLAYVFLVVVL